MRGSAWELKFDAERGLLGGFGGLLGGVWVLLEAFGRRWGVLGGSWGFLGGLLLSWLRFGGSLGATWGLQGVEKRSFGNSGCQLEPVLAPKEPPGPPENAPKRAQEAPKSTFKSIVKCKTSLYQKCWFSSSKMKIFEGGRARVGAQNRRREAPR